MTIQFPARKKSVRHASPPPLELRDVRATRNGAHPQVTLVLSRPLTEYEARVVWEFFPLASAAEGSTKITVHLMRRPPIRPQLDKDVWRISQRAVALERQHERIFERYRTAVKAERPSPSSAVKPPSA